MSELIWFEHYGDVNFPDLQRLPIAADGLFGAGGNLSCTSLLNAYKSGCFPWFNEDQPILWWCPDPRMVLKPSDLHISKSLKKHLRKHDYQLSLNRHFEEVIEACAKIREEGTWISPDMQAAYCALHERGYAHSVELYQDDVLVGGLYGIALGKVFFGESMFSRQSNASKIAFTAFTLHLKQLGFEMIDCQVETDYLRSFGAQNIDRHDFLSTLDSLCQSEPIKRFQTPWQCQSVSRFIHENG